MYSIKLLDALLALQKHLAVQEGLAMEKHSSLLRTFVHNGSLQVRPEPTHADNLSVALLMLPTNVILGWKCLPWTNTLDYYEHLAVCK
jgi:hypothetical protein